MEITREKSPDQLTIRLVGRLDASWCKSVQDALAAAVREGEHRIHLDMAGVSYVSSAGLRVLLTCYKQLKGINGLFAVSKPSPAVRSVLELAGMEMLIAPEPTAASVAAASAANAAAAEATAARSHESANATYEVFSRTPRGGTNPAISLGLKLRAIGDPALLGTGAGASRVPPSGFGANDFALGLGALGPNYGDCEGRFGEFLAVAGSAAFQPSDGSNRPDFVVSQGALVPEGYLLLGVSGEGMFPTLARFEAKKERRTVTLTELAETALALSDAPVAAFVGLTETSGLVGASLRRSPAPAGARDARFGFPQIRDWLSFTTERAFRDSTTLFVGVAARGGTTTPLDSVLRPLGASGLRAHVHAAAFPYRPLRKGQIDLKASVSELFDGHTLQSVLHLLADPREFNGAGDSEFFRGALWVAPAQTS